MSWFTNLVTSIKNFFTSDKAKALAKQIADILPIALIVVKEINAMAPNRTLAQINTITEKYALPTITSISNDPLATGSVLLDLGTQIMQKNHVPDVIVSTIKTALSLAVSLTKVQN